jgi:hypothetical protein
MSSEKQYKYIEDKIKDAADVADYAFNEASWKKMEALLDKKKDKRRPFFWIFSAFLLGALVVGGGIIYQTGYRNQQSENTRKPVDDKGNGIQTTQSLNETADKVIDKQVVLPESSTGNDGISSATDNINNTNNNKDLVNNTNRFTCCGR